MSDWSDMKPEWLADFHAYLRAHPIRRAVFWSIACLALWQLAHLWFGEAITPNRFLFDALCWGGAGVLFYAGMRWYEARHAR
jgi:hypothetical protein